MKVKFLQDFRGRETNEIYYVKGQEVELSAISGDLIERGICEVLPETESEPAPALLPPLPRVGKRVRRSK